MKEKIEKKFQIRNWFVKMKEKIEKKSQISILSIKPKFQEKWVLDIHILLTAVKKVFSYK